MLYGKFSDTVLIHRSKGLLGVVAFLIAMALPVFAAPKLIFKRFAMAQGLSQEVVTACFQDREGFLWVGTQAGLNRFDGYQFLQFKHGEDQPGSISANEILSIAQDAEGTLWIGTQSAGLNRFDPFTQSFTSFSHDPTDPTSLSANAIQEIIPDPQGFLWIPTWGGGLNRFDPKTGRATRYTHDPAVPNSLSNNTIWDCDVDRAGRIWLATELGVDCFDPVNESFKHYRHDPNNPQSLSGERVMAVCASKDGRIWIGTETDGLNLLDPASGRIERIPRGEPGSQQFGFLGINAITQDKDGNLWIGADHGISRYFYESGLFENYIGNPSDPQSLPANTIWRIYQDHLGNMWFGTFEGLYSCRPDNERFGFYQRKNPDGTYANEETLYRMASKDARYIWMTSARGLTRYDRRTSSFQTWNISQDERPSDLTFGDLHFDGSGRLWVAFDQEVLIFDEKTQQFQSQFLLGSEINAFAIDESGSRLLVGTRTGLFVKPSGGEATHWEHRPDQPTSLSADAILEVFIDSQGRFWAGTYGNGLDCLRPGATAFKHYRHQIGDSQSLANDTVNTFLEKDGILWIGTRDGLSKLDLLTDQITNYTTANVLPNNFINGTLFDDAGFLWISTDAGLCKLDPRTETFTHFDESQGLLGDVYHVGSCTAMSDGALVFGGDGFNLFYPNKVAQSPKPMPIVLTDLLLFNEVVDLTSPDKPTPLAKPLRYNDQIELSYKDYVLAFQFAALDFSFSDKRTYQYKLEGFDSDWINASSIRLASYTNLPGGTYQFRVKGSNQVGEPNLEASIGLKILPPPWKTPLAYVFYVCFVVGLIAWYVRHQDRKLLKERQIVARLNEVDHLKDEFLANTSHELRTPLHGMIGLAESLLDGAGGELSLLTREHLLMIKSSGIRLANLVNDILDFSKMEHNCLTCNIQAVDLHSIVSVVFGLTRPLISGKNLQLENNIPKNLSQVLADENRLQQILFNLIGNAIKFTDTGRISLDAKVEGSMVSVSVSDTGIGIAEDKIQQIFLAFEQADGSDARVYGGTGLGLAVTRRLVEIQGGKISASSSLSEGSTFTFTLPKAQGFAHAEEGGNRVPAMTVPENIQELATHAAPVSSEIHRFRILIVDDDPVNRLVLMNHLSRDYNVVAVESGPAAIEAVDLYQGFDLILLDVMMPRMTGFEVCQKLRLHFPAHELPVIYLTAKRRESDVVAGFETGANDFIFKPVSKGELLMRVETHLRLLDTHRNLEARVADRTNHLVETQKELLREAHVAGMAEIAVDVMHTVGNCLNSLGTSIHLIREAAQRDQQGIQLLERVNASFADHAGRLTHYLTEDPNGRRVPEYLPRITATLLKNQQNLAEESDKMTEALKTVTEAVRAQQQHSVLTGTKTQEQINEIVGTVLNLSTLSQGRLETQLDPHLPRVLVNRARLMRVLMCTYQNAIEAVEGMDTSGQIQVSTSLHDNQIRIALADNGVGISAENLIKIFAYGFSTKPSNPGIGLHYCANTLKEMGCDFSVESAGPGKGTQVNIHIPI